MVPSHRTLLLGTVCCFVVSSLIAVWVIGPTLATSP